MHDDKKKKQCTRPSLLQSPSLVIYWDGEVTGLKGLRKSPQTAEQAVKKHCSICFLPMLHTDTLEPGGRERNERPFGGQRHSQGSGIGENRWGRRKMQA